VAIVNGASSGIGLATARLFADRDANVALVSRSLDKLKQLVKEIPGSKAFAADITKTFEVKDMVKRVVSHFGRADILVNNTGQGYDAPAEKMDIEILRYIFALSVVGPVVAMQAVIPLMRAQGGGAILNVSSGTALMHLPLNAAYSSLKRALADISLIAREELKNDNITVGIIYPYITTTNFEKRTIRYYPVKPGEEEPTGPQPPDTAEFVAGLIVRGIESGEAEIYAHDWMKQMNH